MNASGIENDIDEIGLLSRRSLLATLATLGGGAFIESASGQSAAANIAKKRRIDFHYHVGPQRPAPNSQNPWTVSRAIEDLDRNDVSVGIISAAAGGGFAGPITNPERPRQAREWNDYAATLGRTYTGRFGLFATLPLPDIDATFKEIDYALTGLKADGFGILTSYGDMWLGDPKLRPAFEELNRRNAVVFVHTTDAPCCTPETLSYWRQPMNGSWLEWPMHTARTIWSLMINGTFRAFPKIRFIFAHGGGVMPLILERIEGFKDWEAVGPDKLRELVPDGMTNEFRQCYFEIAQAFTPASFGALAKIVPASQILFGSDTPFFPISHSARGIDSLDVSAKVKRAINRSNGEVLLPRWRR